MFKNLLFSHPLSLSSIRYESARSSLDAIFGQVVHPGFPITLKPCDDAYGCGYYPSTTGSLYRDGIDLILEGDTVRESELIVFDLFLS